ncbi:MAG: hypothetical protein CVV41_16965 [Candidatus Riflebacteria bacterium HGW-Riflebacteria-1]|jgi:hypothetical protein|nr:MAG: hypothetical protein CVV41_16965 [Candidatus Riflebacteria bacterium HGW-Riflebacteria-1]
MNKANFWLKIFICCALAVILPVAAQALLIANPDEIEVDGLVSFGEDGAAWLRWQGHEMLVTSGFMIGTDLRVVAVRHDSVVLYRSERKQYHVLLPATNLPYKDRVDVIWTQSLPVWKITRMVGLAYRKDYVCHYSTVSPNQVRRHVRGHEAMMDVVVSPHHRFYPRRGLFFVAPVHIQGTGWKHLMDRIQNYRSRTLGEHFAALNAKGTIISDGKPLDQALQRIAFATGVRISWHNPVILPLYCSLRDRPWHEILEAMVVFNGLDIYPTAEGLEIR